MDYADEHHDHAHDEVGHNHEVNANTHEYEEADDHDGTDPHAWLDPVNARVWLGVIEAKLSAADPDNAATYATNADAARQELDTLEAEVHTILEPVADAPVYAFHDAYFDFSAAFGLNVAGSIALGDAADPGPHG